MSVSKNAAVHGLQDTAAATTVVQQQALALRCPRAAVLGLSTHRASKRAWKLAAPRNAHSRVFRRCTPA
jgi:hypothetical protein